MRLSDLHVIKAEIAGLLREIANRYGLGKSEMIRVLRMIILDLGDE